GPVGTFVPSIWGMSVQTPREHVLSRRASEPSGSRVTVSDSSGAEPRGGNLVRHSRPFDSGPAPSRCTQTLEKGALSMSNLFGRSLGRRQMALAGAAGALLTVALSSWATGTPANIPNGPKPNVWTVGTWMARLAASNPYKLRCEDTVSRPTDL